MQSIFLLIQHNTLDHLNKMTIWGIVINLHLSSSSYLKVFSEISRPDCKKLYRNIPLVGVVFRLLFFFLVIG